MTLLRTLVLAVLAAGAAGTTLAQDEPILPRNPVLTWNQATLDTVRATSASDAQAARLYAMVNVAIYDAVNGIDVADSFLGRTHALVPPDAAPRHGSRPAAAAAAAHAVLRALFPARAALYDAQLAADLAALGNSARTRAGRDWGRQVGGEVVAARANDGSSPAETQPAGSGPGQFRAPWTAAQFRNLVPFAIENPAVYVSPGPPPLDSAAYAAALAEVQILGSLDIPNPEGAAIATFWNSGNGTVQPPGEWMKLAITLTETRPLRFSLSNTARLFALLGMALSDAVAPTFQTKFQFHFWRPVTAIQEADTDGNPNTDPDPAWRPRLSAGSPEHTSGHSSFAGAGPRILSGFFCKDTIAFDLTTDSAPAGPRHYDSFSEAAAEAGRSRIFGGIHFEFSNQAGLRTGRGVANEILARKLLRRLGPTHFGDCPL